MGDVFIGFLFNSQDKSLLLWLALMSHMRSQILKLYILICMFASVLNDYSVMQCSLAASSPAQPPFLKWPNMVLYVTITPLEIPICYWIREDGTGL